MSVVYHHMPGTLCFQQWAAIANVLMKAGLEPLADTLLEFRPCDFQKAASGSFMAITIINHTVATLIMHDANPG